MPSRLRTILFAVLTFAMSFAVFAAAAVVPAPAAVLPLAAFICIGCPAIAVWQLRGHSLGADPEPLRELRRGLAQLPEVDHPLGL